MLNNLYSKHARSCHLNVKHHEYLQENEQVIDEGSFYNENLGKVSYVQYAHLLIITMGLNGVRCRFLIDTGAEVDAISEEWVTKHKDAATKLVDSDIIIQMATKEAIAHGSQELSSANIVLFPNATSKKYSTTTDLLVLNIDTTRFDGILGIKTLHELGIRLQIPKMDNLAEACRRFDDEMLSKNYSTGKNFSKENFSPEPEVDDKFVVNEVTAELEANEKIRINQWTTMENGVIRFSLTDEQLAKAYKNKNVHNFVSLKFYEDVDKWVVQAEEDGVIEFNNENTPFNLPLLAVRQNNIDGSLKKVRVCVDFRQLNQFLKMDSYPIPKFQEMHASFRGAKWFSVIDLKSGYNQVPVAEECRKYMAFTWRRKQYRFKGTPFGLNFLPSQFNRMLAHCLHGIKGVIVYIDDIIIFSKCKLEHAAAVKEVLQRLNKHNMKINKDKCMLGRTQVNFLGFILSQAGIQVDPARTKRLVNLKIPTTGAELTSFLAMANFIRQHIPGFGKATAILYDIAAKNPRKLCNCTRWMAEGLPAWEQLKEMLQSPATLQYPDPNKRFILRTDACVTGFGGYLYQEGENGEILLIHTFSGGFKGAQRGYSIPKKELFAIVYALRHLSFYLRGADFRLECDAKCLQDVMNMESQNETVVKWLFEISPFNPDIEHIPGKDNIFADLLSRQSISSTLAEWKRYEGQYIIPNKNLSEETVTSNKDDPLSLCSMQTVNTTARDLAKYPPHLRKRICTFHRRRRQSKQKLPFNADTFTNDWKLALKFYQKADERWGSHTVDTFAASHNAQVSRYYTKELNAFGFSWRNENPWINPPWNLIGRVLRKVKNEQIEATICVPHYIYASWYEQLKEMAIDHPIVIPRSNDVFLRRGTEQAGNTPWDLTLLVRISGKTTRATPVIDWNFSAEKATADANHRAARINVLTKVFEAEVSKTYSESNSTPTENNVPNINVFTRAMAAANAQPTPDAPEPQSGPELAPAPTDDEDSDDEDGSIFDVDGPAPLLDINQPGKAGPSNEHTFAEKVRIVRRYHSLTHASKNSLVTLVRETGRYNWDNLTDIVKLVDDNCYHCELKQHERKGYHPLRSTRSRFAGDVWVMDLMQVPRYQDEENESAFILHVTDHWSGFNFLRALPDKSSASIAHHLVSIMMDHGCPKKILYDNGKEFQGKCKEALEKVAKTVSVTSVPYHPQSQGANERRHTNIRDDMILLLNQQTGTRDWKRTVPFAQMRANLKPHRKHGSTPFAVYFGRTHNLFNTDEAVTTAREWIDEISGYDDLIIPKLNERMNEYYDDQEQQFLKAHEEQIIEHEPNQLVKVCSKGQQGVVKTDKLSYKVKGPFRILEKTHGGYNIGFPWATGPRAHIKLNDRPVPPEEIYKWTRIGAAKEQHDSWVVESIKGTRTRGGQKQYHVCWEGNWKPTWEPSNNLPPEIKDAYSNSLYTRNKRKRSKSLPDRDTLPVVQRGLLSTD